MFLCQRSKTCQTIGVLFFQGPKITPDKKGGSVQPSNKLSKCKSRLDGKPSIGFFLQTLFSIIMIINLNACNPTQPARPEKNSIPEILPTTIHEPASQTVTEISTKIEATSSTPTHFPSPVSITEEPTEQRMVTEAQILMITIVYDNRAYDTSLKSDWGFSAFVENHDQKLLFDTGGNGAILLENMRILGIDPSQLEIVVLSHIHSDHTGGLQALLSANHRPTVYLLPSFPAEFKHQIEQSASVVEVTPGMSICEGITTTGEMGPGVGEQALVIRTSSGLVVITGCAHPGIIEIVKKSQEMFNQPVRLVLGGFHLGSEGKAELTTILREFRRLGVEQVAPGHCTGDQAIDLFASEYGEDFIEIGAGQVIRISDRFP